MKNKLLLLAILLFSAGFLYSQDTLPNMNFERWDTLSGGAYEEPAGGVWTTANKIALMGMPVTTELTTDAESGKYAVKITTKSYVGMILSGTLATGIFNSNATPPANLVLGKPFTGRPLHFTGYYKYIHNAGDSCDIYATLSKWNGSAHVIVGKAMRQHSPDSVTTYTKFDLPFVYYTNDTPDSISVVFASSSAGASMKGHVGSTLYIDNINLEYTSGINEILNPSMKVQCYPIPAKTAVHFILERNVINGHIKIFNELGSEIKMINGINKEFSIPVNNLSKGKYYYQIIEGNSILNSGYFLVN
jgi:hypothetical protein